MKTEGYISLAHLHLLPSITLFFFHQFENFILSDRSGQQYYSSSFLGGFGQLENRVLFCQLGLALWKSHFFFCRPGQARWKKGLSFAGTRHG